MAVATTHPSAVADAGSKLTFAQHVYELRKRLMWSLLFVGIGAGIGYALNDAILTILQHPLHEKLYYTTPTGAFSFIIKVCCVFGFVVSLPVVVYQVFGFFGPLLPVRTRRSFVLYSFLSVFLALMGVAFAYFVSLPASLRFLVNFGSGSGNIQALITADEYFNFVLTYIAGFAALFQLPLVVTFINKIKPLKPTQLLGYTRYVILGSFIVSAIITPTPDPLNQALMAGPIILLYFFSVGVVAVANRARRRKNSAKTGLSQRKRFWMRSKAEPVVPELSAASIEAVLADEDSLRPFSPTAPTVPALPVAPVPTQPVGLEIRPLGRVSVQGPAPRRMVSDVVRPSGRNQPLAPFARSQPASPVVPRTAPRPMRMRVISDFIPATEQ
ncbi:MAG TPA: twin-arginine translocase subunit TatC [Candidatus Limnocylindria bacterium]|nr:twin-arginine translocase subunit TatC [Candidatus Limnocylindria bacterium]